MSPLCSPLSNEDRRALLELARRAILEAVRSGHVLDFPPPTGALKERSGAFVTLHLRGRLRGCIGQVEPACPLAETVVRCARGAALEDPRFSPVIADEVGNLNIEVSILSALHPASPEDVEIGRHGLVVMQGGRRGLLLPQVALERAWLRERFLEETCLKTGLEPNAWKDPETRLWVFTTEIFSEADYFSPRPAPVD